MSKHYRAIPDYYDEENAHYQMLQQDVPFFLNRLGHHRLQVLELAVGTGRAAIPIAQAGHRVVGVDYAQEMLDAARPSVTRLDSAIHNCCCAART